MSSIKVDERKYWVLLALEASEGKSITPVQLQKSLFLLSQMTGIKKGFYKFKPYDYGPFAPDVYQDAEQLERDGLISISYEHGLKTYLITSEGKKLSNEVKKKSMPSNIVQRINDIVSHVQSLDFKELVQEIYRDYPKYRANSVFRD